MRMKYYILLLPFLFAGCIDEYVPKDIEEVNDLLIIDGTITNDTSVFRLNRSVGLTESLIPSETTEDGADLYVESENGARFAGQFQGAGVYIVPTGPLNPSDKYRLNVSVGGEEYQSSFLTPLTTPEIDSVTPEKRGEGQSVYMCVSTHDPTNQSRYYRWTFKEHWEVKADLYANAGFVDDNIIIYSLNTSVNRYYCWGQDTSKVILLGTTEKLSDNVISMKRLNEIPPFDDRLSILYYIAVEQMMIRKEAYDYFLNMQKNVEQTGSIFSPVPSEMKGNIRCTTNPDLPVIGYIEVTTTTRKQLFIPERAGYYEPPYSTCGDEVTDDNHYAPPIMGYYYYAPMGETLFAPWRCVDCTQKRNASKNKPDFWPNNHL